MTEIRLYKSVWQGVKLILLSSVFVVPAIYFLYTGDDEQWLNWVCICFFGLGYPVGLFMILDRRPKIIISETGIYDRDLGEKVINWEIIRDAYLAEVRKQKFICLVVDENFIPSKNKGKLYKAVVQLNEELLGVQELNISISHVKADADKLLLLIQKAITADHSQRKELLRIGTKSTS